MNHLRICLLAFVSLLAGCVGMQRTQSELRQAAARAERRKRTVERLVTLMSELSLNKNSVSGSRPLIVDPWQHADWREVFSHCRNRQGEAEAEVIWGGSDDVEDDSIRFVCNTAPRVNGQRVIEGDKFWATPWYNTGDLERKSFYLEKFLTGVALVDGSQVQGMLDAAHGAPYDSSYRLLKDYWPALVAPDLINAALVAWIDRYMPYAESRIRPQVPR